jgi:small subunit ribosomal protein S1
MSATYDNEGNYIYPEGFDSETGEWLEGFDKQREEWERQYAEARQRWEAHTKQVQTARAADAVAEPAPASGGAPAAAAPAAAPRAAEEPSGTLATDEALAALREKLAGGKS